MKKKNIVKIYKVEHLTNGDNPMPYATNNSVEIVEYDEGEQPSLADMKSWVRSGNNSMIELIKVIHEGKTCFPVTISRAKLVITAQLPTITSFTSKSFSRSHAWYSIVAFKLNGKSINLPSSFMTV